MATDGPALTPELRAALTETLADPLRTQVYIAVYERPGATVAQVAGRIEEPVRRVRHQIDRLIEVGLVIVEAESLKRNARERHHRAVAVPTLDERGEPLTEEDRRDVTLSMTRFLAADVGRAVRHRSLGTRAGHAEVRVPGEVDERGWAELAALMIETMESVEGTMIAGAQRLQAAERSGIEVICGLLFFEAPGWARSAETRQGPRPSPWARPVPGLRSSAGPAPGTDIDPADLAPELRDAMIEALGDQLRARVLITVAERPGVTIGQIATRMGEPPRRVRHQVEQLITAGLVLVDAETPKRNARERHHRVVALPMIDDEVATGWTDEQRRKGALSTVRVMVADLDAAARDRTFGSGPGHAVVRIPGEVDQRGWDELAATILRGIGQVEEVMIGSFGRLEEAGRAGTEVVSALLLFEGAPWEQGGGDRQGPRPTHWRAGRDAKIR